MRNAIVKLLVMAWPVLLPAQTAEELVAKNLEARGGIENIKAIKSLRMTGTVLQPGGFIIQFGMTGLAPNLLRQTYTVQGMTEIDSYDGAAGWKISPFQGRKDPELMGEDELRGISEDADFYGPLVDYTSKDNRIEYLGHDTVDGDDVYRLKVTLANGDILNYYLDPDTYLEIRTERMQFIRGAVQERVTNLGSYKKVAGVYFPFSLETGGKRQAPAEFARITIDKIEANLPVESGLFEMPKPKPAATSAKEQ